MFSMNVDTAGVCVMVAQVYKITKMSPVDAQLTLFLHFRLLLPHPQLKDMWLQINAKYGMDITHATPQGMCNLMKGHRAAGAGADFTDGFHCSGALICRQQETQLQGHSR